jgi:hypothetical protein
VLLIAYHLSKLYLHATFMSIIWPSKLASSRF